MWTLLKGLALRFAMGRTIGGMFATLVMVLLPIGGLLKLIGLPLLAVLGTLGAPIVILLAMIGLPILLVLAMGSALLLVVGVALTLGLMALKILLPVVLLVWLLRWAFGRRDGPVVEP